MTDQPTLRILSLGAGVQSTSVLLLAAEGRLPKPDAAIFANTGWEPKKVYRHLERLNREVAQPAGIPIYEVSAGNIRNDALDPTHRFASMPLFIKNQDGGDGMTRRQCSNEYKVKVIKAQTRALLGYPHPKPVPRGVYVEQWIGISRDEIERANDADVKYMRNAFPLLDMGGGSRWPRRLDPRRLPALSEHARLRRHPQERLYRLPVPRQRPVAPHAGRGAGGVGGRGRLRPRHPFRQRPGQRQRQAAPRRGVPPPVPAPARPGADRPRDRARVAAEADRHLRPDRRCRARRRRPRRLLPVGLPLRPARDRLSSRPPPRPAAAAHRNNRPTDEPTRSSTVTDQPIPLTEQQLDEIEARATAALHCPNAAANGRLDGEHTFTGSFTTIRCELCDYSRPRGERAGETAGLVATVRRLQQQRKFLLGQLAKRDAESGRGDEAVRAFLAAHPDEDATAAVPAVVETGQ